MKRKCNLILIFLLFLVIGANAQIFIDDLYYNLSDTEATVTESPDKYTGDIIIPDSIEYDEKIYFVTRIDENAFSDCTDMTSVVIGDSITHIGDYAFQQCSNLTSIIIPGSVTYIGEGAFSFCTGLTSIMVLNPVPVTITSDVFDSVIISACKLITLSTEVASAYGSAEIWRDFDIVVVAVISTSVNNEAYGSIVRNIEKTLYTPGDTIIFTAYPEENYYFVNWISGEDVLSVENPYSHVVECDTSIMAVFSKIPTLSFVSPANGSIDNPRDTLLSVTFEEDIVLTNNEGVTILPDPGNVSVSVADSILSIFHDNFTYETTYTVTIQAGTIRGYEEPISWSFTTINEPLTMSRVEIDSLYYNLFVTKAKVASNNNCAEEIIIPETVEYDNVTYIVSEIEDQAFSGCTELHRITMLSPDPIVVGETSFEGIDVSLCKLITISEESSLSYGLADVWKDFDIVSGRKITVLSNDESYGLVSRDSDQLFYVPGDTLILTANPEEGYYFINWTSDEEELSEENSYTHIITTSMEIVGNFGVILDYTHQDGIYYNLSGTEATVTVSPNKYSGDLVIPESIYSYGQTYTVTGIESTAFVNCTALRTISLPSTIISIGGGTFSGCSLLVGINVDENNTIYSSEDGVLYTYSRDRIICYPISKSGAFIIPETVNNIDGVFKDRINLTSIVIPNSITGIGNQTFFGCNGLTNVLISSTVTSIGDQAFSNCYVLSNVTILNPTPITISSNVFFNVNLPQCTLITPSAESASSYGLAEIWRLFNVVEGAIITVSVNNSTMGSVSRDSDKILYAPGETITVSASIEEGYYFVNWTAGENVLSTDNPYIHTISTSMDLVANLSEIPNTAVVNGIYYELTDTEATVVSNPAKYSGELIIPETIMSYGKSYTVTGIKSYAFQYSTELTSISIPATVNSIGEGVFSGCSKLRSIEIDESNPNYLSEEGVLFSFNKDTLLCYPSGKEGDYVIPEIVTDIDGAFEGCANLTSILIPSSITRIGDNTFSGCSSLTSVVIPNTVTIIGFYAFQNCSSLSSIIIGSSVGNIGNSAFALCANLSYITVLNPTPVTTINSFVFYGVTASSCKLITISSESAESYRSANVWKEFDVVKGSVVTVSSNEDSYGSVNRDSDRPFYAPGETITFTATSEEDCYFVCWMVEDEELSVDNPYLYVVDTDAEVVGKFSIVPNSAIVDGIYYSLSETEATVVANPDKYSGTLAIPETISCYERTYTVTSISNDAFLNNTDLISVGLSNLIVSIGDRAFQGCGNLLTVALPESLTALGDSAFRDCVKLPSPDLPELLISIGEKAFSNTLLSRLMIPGSVSYIGNGAFGRCALLTSIDVDESNSAYQTIDGILFNKAGDKLLCYPSGKQGEYIISETVRDIDGAFDGCAELSTLIIPNTISQIGDYTFSGCTGLIRITILSPDPIVVGETSFEGLDVSLCKLITISEESSLSYGLADVWKDFDIVSGRKITVLSNDESYGLVSRDSDQLFYAPGDTLILTSNPEEGYYFINWTSDGEELSEENPYTHIITTSMEIVGNFALIPDIAVIDGICYNLSNPEAVVIRGLDDYAGTITIPSSVVYFEKTYTVTDIASRAFSNCPELTSVVIPNTVTSIGNGAFADCPQLENIVLAVGNEHYLFENNILFSDTKDRLVYYPVWKSGEYTILETVKSIDGAFEGCTGLTSIIIPASVTSIGDNTFANCINLKSILILNPNPLAINANVFYNVDQASCKLIAPSTESAAVYKITDVWKEFNVVIGFTVTLVSNNDAFGTVTRDNDKIRYEAGDIIVFRANPVTGYYFIDWKDEENTLSIANPYQMTVERDVDLIGYFGKILNTVTIDGISYSLSGVNAKVVANPEGNVGDIIIPETISCYGGTYSVTVIGSEAFRGCTQLTSVMIPKSITSIEQYAFAECPGLTSIVIPDLVTVIADRIFYNCSNLKSVTISGQVTNIGIASFQGCSSLTSIVIPNSTTRIGDNAFRDCASLTSIVIPNLVARIGDNAFLGCTKLASAVIGQSVSSIGNSAFENCNKLVEIYNLSNLSFTKKSPTHGYVSNYALVIHKDKDTPSILTQLEDYTFAYSEGFGYLIDYSGDDTSLELPNSFDYDNQTIDFYLIHDYAFRDCENLLSITIPNSVTGIKDYAFYGCLNIQSITMHNLIPLEIKDNVFTGVNTGECVLTVPVSAVSAYQDAVGWREFNIVGKGFVITILVNEETYGNVSYDNIKTLYETGDVITFTAEPLEGYYFVSWMINGEILSIENEYLLTVTGDMEIVANFDEIITLSSFSPGNEESDVALDAPITVVFSKDVNLSTTEGVTISPDPGDVSISVEGSVLTITHNDFAYETTYEVIIPAGTIEGYNEAIHWSFTTLKSVYIDNPIYKSNITIYPNPTKDEVRISVAGIIRLFNTNGAPCLIQTVEAQQAINISHLPAGLYLYILEDKYENKISGKLIIQ